jgi:RNA polymerase sigma-70 factor (ECF subfamily)
MLSSDRIWREQGLLNAVLAGNEQAWRTWYEESFEGLYAYIAWHCAGLRDLTDELVQETWLTAVRCVRHFDPQRGSFASWLRGIAVNVLRNQLRLRKRRRQHDRHLRNGCAAATDDAVEQREQAERIAAALAALPAHYEAVLRAKYLDEQSMAEIADAWKETPKAIESLLTRARQAFREAYLKRE